MTPLEVLLQLGTVFLGAFLAFGLENLRERRQLRGWANEYLKRVRDTLSTGEGTLFVTNLEKSLRDYVTFVSFGLDHTPSEDEWSLLMTFYFTTYSDHRALLESPAVRVLPADFVTTLAELDERRRSEEAITQLCSSNWQTYVVPLVLRQAQMTAEERRGLEYAREFFKVRLDYARERAKAEMQVLELLDRYNLGR